MLDKRFGVSIAGRIDGGRETRGLDIVEFSGRPHLRHQGVDPAIAIRIAFGRIGEAKHIDDQAAQIGVGVGRVDLGQPGQARVKTGVVPEPGLDGRQLLQGSHLART